MSSPVPYNELFDIDGLKAAIKEAEVSSDSFGKSATQDFKRIEAVAASLRKELEAINATLNGKPIKLMDDAGQAQIIALSKQISDLTSQFNTQKQAIEGLNRVLSSNKQTISDAKAQHAQLTTELKKGQVATQDTKLKIAETSLAMRQFAQANQQAKQATDAASGSYKEAQQRLAALGASIRNAEGGFTSSNPAIKAQIVTYNELNGKLKDFDSQMGNHQRKFGDYGGALNDLSGQLKGLVLGYISIQGALAAATAAFDTALQTDASRTSLTYILGSAELADTKLNTLKKTADNLGLEFISLSKTYAQFVGSTSAAGVSLSTSEKIFYSVARAAAVLHLSSDQVQQSLYAIQQMFDKGSVQAEELKRQLGNALPGALSIMAKSLNVSNGELMNMMKNGELLSTEVLPKFADQLDKTFAPGIVQIESLQASFNDLKNVFSEGIDENSPIKAFFKQIIDGLTTVSKTLIKTFNEIGSKNWSGLFARLTNNGTADRIDAIKGSYNNSVAGINSIGDLSNQSPEQLGETYNKLREIAVAAKKAYDDYANGVADGSLKDSGNLKDYKNVADILYSKLNQIKLLYPEIGTEAKKVNELSDAQLTSLSQIRKRITDLSKLPGSAVDGSDINNRIDALKARLKSLTPSTKAAKDGFALLEEQIKKTMLLLQDSIIQDYAKNQGRQTERTLKLADAYNTLNKKLKEYQDAQFKALHGDAPALERRGDPNNPIDNRGQSDVNVAQANIDASALTNDLDDVVQKYAVFNQKLSDSYLKGTLTRAQYELQLSRSNEIQWKEEYPLRTAIIGKELTITAAKYGTDSKQYRTLLSQQTALFQQNSDKRIGISEKEREKLIKIYDDIFNLLKKNGDIIGNLYGQNTGKLFSDLADGFEKAALAQKTGSEISFGDQMQLGGQIAMDAVGTYTDFAIQASQARMAQLETEKQHDLDMAGNNADAKAKIEDAYNKKITAEKKKQAKLKKAEAITDIIINTAIAISKTLAETAIFGIPLIPIIAGLGAIELGLVLAQPLPAYEKGRSDGKSEFALVNEKGPELIGKNGQYRIANKGMKGIAYLNQGDQVKTATDTKSLMANNLVQFDGQRADNISQTKMIYDTYVMTASRSNGIDYDKMAGAVEQGISGLPITENNYDERGYQQNIRIKNTRIMDVKRRNQF